LALIAANEQDSESIKRGLYIHDENSLA